MCVPCSIALRATRQHGMYRNTRKQKIKSYFHSQYQTAMHYQKQMYGTGSALRDRLSLYYHLSYSFMVTVFLLEPCHSMEMRFSRKLLGDFRGFRGRNGNCVFKLRPKILRNQKNPGNLLLLFQEAKDRLQL